MPPAFTNDYKAATIELTTCRQSLCAPRRPDGSTKKRGTVNET
ncbi:hypothetical protein SUBVAR_06901 [Subdoligranulum variabile DSM 15176]|uniref:Uncharacterized protein n=1 Tax=Subdoligranulum variabile DSM 15176 TaxID=411471 RepID=D1PR73_9FIRM|nr:hypothetical protein SUBVAR_06901 [Subdoligranulum variabile DSM 15176]